MTLSKYRELMDRVQVTDEMRERVLAAACERAEKRRKAPWLRLISGRAFGAVAACFALLLAGTLAPFLLRESANGPETDLAAPVGGMEEMASAGELARAVGFPVEELSGLPVKAEKVEYLSCFGELAQITWSGAEGTAVFRKTAGSGDPSGDYNIYETVARREVGEIQVTLKGQGDKISLAVWESGGFSYSFSIDPPAAEEKLLALVSQMAAPDRNQH